MSRCSCPKTLTSILTALALVFGTGVAATFAISPDAAFAKNDKSNGNGGGRDKSDRGNSGGRDKASRGNGKSKGGNSQAARGFQKDNGKAKGQAKRTRSAGKSNGQAKRTRSASKRDPGSNTIAGLGRDFKRDVKALFGRGTEKPRKARKQRSTAISKATRIDTSPRPAARNTVARPVSEGGKHPVKRRRDPLVRAITDPYGSDKLRNLNASKAAAPAFANASPNSNVGKIATYQEAAADYYGLRDDLGDARRDLRELDESYDGRASEEIKDDIADLDPADPEFDAKRDELVSELKDARSYEVERAELAGDVKDLKHDTYDALEVAEAAFYDASKGRTLTRDALGEFHRNLDLPQPKDRRKDYAKVTPYPKDGAEIQPVPADRPSHGDRPGKKHRDPLIRAISDPYGSDKLRNLNASKAAAPAFANASPNSNVGKIATYQEAAADYYGLRGDLGDARRDLRELDESYDGRSSEDILGDIADLDPADPEYDAKRDALENELAESEKFEEARDDLADDVRKLRRQTVIASKDAESAFYQASKGAVLTREALAELHGNLGLPAPIR